jgi:sugar lactone lactonase YvrE
MKNILFLSLVSILFTSCSTGSIFKIDRQEAPFPKLKWTLTDPNIQNPESTYYEPATKVLYVSNVAGQATQKDKKGWISKVDPIEGKILVGQWVSGLNAPKGMRADRGILYVADIDQVVAIDMAKAKVISKIKIAGAKFLNDIAIDNQGVVYVSDMMTGKIHSINAGKAELFAKDPESELPNGLLIKNGKLWVTTWGIGMNPDFSTQMKGNLVNFDLKTKSKNIFTTQTVGNLDGLESDGSTGFFASDWMLGKVYWINHEGIPTQIFEDKQGTADIGYIAEPRMLIVPQMMSSQILGFEFQ